MNIKNSVKGKILVIEPLYQGRPIVFRIVFNTILSVSQYSPRSLVLHLKKMSMEYFLANMYLRQQFFSVELFVS